MKNKLKSIVVFAIFVSSLFICAHASTSGSISELYYLDFYGSMYPNFNSPYTIAEGEGDVNKINGALCTNVEDYRIKGKNGFDVPIVRSYNSASTEADIYEVWYDNKVNSAECFYNYYICSKDNEVVKVLFENQAQMFEADPSFEGREYYSTKSYNTYERLKQEGSGIFYTLLNQEQKPTKQYENSYERLFLNSINYASTFINLEDGSKISKPCIDTYDNCKEDELYMVNFLFQDLQAQTYAFYIDYDISEKPDYVLSAGKASGVSYSKYSINFVDRKNADTTAIHPLGFEYTFTLEADTGEKYYVYKESRITYRVLYGEDRYGNGYLINNQNDSYTIITPENIVYDITSNGITKTHNDTVSELVRYDTEVINSEKDIYDKYDIDDEYVFTVTKNTGDTPQIQGDEEAVVRYYIKRAIKFEETLHNVQLAAYKLPYKIELQSGLTKHIEYTSVPWIVSNWGDEGLQDGWHYPVSRYYETDFFGNIRNDSLYSYVTDEDSDDIIYISKIVETTVVDGDNKKITNNINRRKQIESRLVQNNSKSESVEYKYDYNNSTADSLISFEDIYSTHQSADSGNYYKTYGYKNNHFITRETYGDYEVNYTYHEDGNFIPATIIYNRDANTEVKTVNTLTEDKKSILTTDVYENDVLIKSTSYTYDEYGNVASESVMADSETSYVVNYDYTYATDGGYTLTTTKTNIKDADGNTLPNIVTIDVYDEDHNLVSHTDANGYTTTMTYDKLGRLLSTVYPDCTTDSYTYDISDGITTYTAPNGTVYKAYFDAWQNPIRKTVVLDGEEITLEAYEYDDRCNVKSYTRYIDDTDFVKAVYTYDYLDRPLTEDIYSGNTLVKSTAYTYTVVSDSSSKPLTTVTATITGDDGTYASTSQTTNYRGFVVENKLFTDTDSRANTYTHDYVGNVITATDAMGNTTATSYDGLNNPVRLIYPDGTSVSTAYNLAGLPVSVTDARGNTSHSYYDNAGRLIRSTSPVDSNTTSESKLYYDGNGNVISKRMLSSMGGEAPQYVRTDTAYDSMNRPVIVTSYPDDDTESITKYAYDIMGNVTSVTNGLSSETSALSMGHTTSYEYDALGRMVEETAPNGKAETNVYDLAGRIVSSADKMNTQSTYIYDAFDNLLSVDKGEESISYTYDLMGNRTSMTDSTGTTSYTYSPYGELTNEQKDSILKSYTYDVLGRRTAMSVYDGESNLTTQNYTYDNMGRLISTQNGTDTAEYTYDANSNILTEAVNGTLLKSTTYNKANLPETIATYLPDSTETSYRIYTADGNLRMETKGDKESFYYYDGANRLISESIFGTVNYEDFYTYDRFGNRVNKEHTDLDTWETQSTDYVYNSSNQLIEQNDGLDTYTYTYDDNGNMLKVKKNEDTIKTYTYDDLNRLATANVNGNNAQYTYNGDNLRQTKTVNGVITEHIYDGQNIVADISEDTNTYIYGLSLIGMRTNKGNLQIYATTPRGDVDKLINSDGTYAEYEYDAYGKPIADNSHTENPFGYTGEYQDLCSGLIYLRNRYYDPSIGRFISEDPARDGLNWYVYCSNNPINRIDPSGLKDYIYTSQTEYYVENDWGFWEFLNTDRYYAEIEGSRYQANSKETVTLYDWSSFDTKFLNETLDSLVDKANEKSTGIKRILSESVGGDLDFKLQMEKETLYLANGVLYNRNEAGNYVWAYYLESQNVSGYISGALAQGGSLIPPLANMDGLPRLDEEWDRKARWSGIKYYYDRNNQWWIYYALYGGRTKY